jgi:glutaredoxin 3
VETPTLYVKRGCPYCKAAMEHLDAHQVSYRKVEVRGDAARMKELEKISGQTKTPTLVWDGAVLANFGTDELVDFLAGRQPTPPAG